MSPMSDVRRDAPAAGLIHRVLPMQLPVQILLHDPSLHSKQAFRNKHRHVYILYAGLFETTVQLFLDVLPDCIACRFDRPCILLRWNNRSVSAFFTTSVYHCAKSSSIDVMASTNFFVFCHRFLLFLLKILKPEDAIQIVSYMVLSQFSSLAPNKKAPVSA